MKTIFTPLCVASLLLGTAGLAQAHVSLETAQANAGSGYKAVLKIRRSSIAMSARSECRAASGRDRSMLWSRWR